MEYTKLVTKELTFVKCDFCEHSTEEQGVWISCCAVCGKDICNDHDHWIEEENTCEDGCLCLECSNLYEFEFSEGIGVIDKKTRESISAPFL